MRNKKIEVKASIISEML